MADQLVDNSSMITGGCNDANNECPPGYTWGCCPDTDVEYPPGYPAFTQCEVQTLNGSGSTEYGHNYAKIINGRMWVERRSNPGCVIYDISNIDGTLTEYKVLTSLADNYPDMVRGHSNYEFDTMTVFNDKVIFGGEDWIEGISVNFRSYIMWVFDLDGNFLEYWKTPPNYNLYPGGGRVKANFDSDGERLVFVAPNADNPSLSRVGVAFWFDYYGTIYNIYETTNAVDFGTVALTDEGMITGYLYSYEHSSSGYAGSANFRNKVTGAKLHALDRDGHPIIYLSGWGASVEKIESNGLDTIYCLNDSSLGSGNASDINSDYTARRFFFDKFGILMYAIEWESELYTNSPGSHFGQPFSDISRYGDYMATGVQNADNPYTDYHHSAKGMVNIYNINTGEFLDVASSPQPIQSYRSGIGVGTCLTRDYIYMFGGGYSHVPYVKICKITWLN